MSDTTDIGANLAGGAKILVVDDKASNLLAIEASLEGMGHQLVTATSGQEALRRLMVDDYAIILLDVQMPTMDGYETARLIRGRAANRHTPILFLTAVGRGEDDMFRGYQAGAVDYLIKPFHPQLLRYKISVLVDLQLKTLEVERLNGELKNHARDLEEANLRLQNLNATLEERVGQATKEISRRNEELARSNGELAQFATVVSHDLQEPLRTMNNYLELLRQEGVSLSGQAEEYLNLAVQSGSQMRHLIRDLLAFSQIDSRKLEAAEEDCDLLVQNALAHLQHAVDRRQADVQIGPLPKIRCYGTLVGQIFQNLIDNALKFCPDRTPHIEVGAVGVDGATCFWVKDNGMGISQSTQTGIFNLFQRLGDSRFKGTGVGLALCKKIVEQQGGKIWVESSPGKGSTFFFTLPEIGIWESTTQKAM